MRGMKDSGAGWIGTIPAQWKVDKLKYHLKRNEPKNSGNKTVLSLYREFGILPKDSRDDNHNITSEDTSKYKYVKPGDFVINKMKAWQGSVAVSGYEGIVSPAYYVYNFTDDVFYKRYFHYLLRSCYKDEFMRLSGGIRVGQWDLSADALENIAVIIPPQSQQRIIANYLDTKCSVIDALAVDIQYQINTLEQYKHSVITKAVTKGINPDIKMKDSNIRWIGEIPSHWKVMPNKYLMYKKKVICPVYNGEDILSLTMQGVIVRDLNAGGKMPTSFDGYQYLEPGNLLMCLFDIDVTPRCIGLIKQSGVSSPAYSQFVLKEGAYAAYYNYYYTMLDNDKTLLHLAKNLRHSLTEEQLGAIPTVVPPVEEQKEISVFLDTKLADIDAVIAEKKEQLTVLGGYKSSLIYEYVTGKKEVPGHES